MRADVCVIGGGPAGLSAATAARKAGAESVLLLERNSELGGILPQCIHNGFGLHYFAEELTGPEYAGRLIAALDGAEICLNSMVLSVSRDKRVTFVSPEYGLTEVECGAVVLATGCRERPRGALGIAGTRPAGVMTAGFAQRLLNIEGKMCGRQVVILGSGDIGLIMARRMAWEGAKVELVAELMPHSTGLSRNIVQCLNDNNIPLLLETTVVRIHGNERVEGVTIAKVDANRKPIRETERFVKCDTLLLSVGLIPENELARAAGVEISPITGGAVVNQFRATSVPGIYACGNALHVHDLVDNVSREAEIAGTAAAVNAPAGEAVPVRTKGLARYTVPQLLVKGRGKTALFFRVQETAKPATLNFYSGGRLLFTRKRSVMRPGEMEEITVDTDVLSDECVLEVL